MTPEVTFPLSKRHDGREGERGVQADSLPSSRYQGEMFQWLGSIIQSQNKEFLCCSPLARKLNRTYLISRFKPLCV
uniref:Uncharacterized protein n=1 Tax=Anguilla anguilla TaxID=7936 RepID=A0A0E9W5C0_ANGAN